MLRVVPFICLFLSLPLQALTLTAQERQLLDELTSIRMCVDPDWLPYDGIGREGQHIGIMFDFHQLWSQKSVKPLSWCQPRTGNSRWNLFRHSAATSYPAPRKRRAGEEFLIICPQTSQHGAMQLAEQIRNQIHQHVFTIDMEMTVSIGVSEYVAGEDINVCIKRADDALYQAKHLGRNQTVLAPLPIST